MTESDADLQGRLRAGQVLQAHDDLHGAIQAYSGVLRLKLSVPFRAYALMCRGSAKDEAGDFDGAIADYDEAIALAPGDANARYMRGLANQARENWLAALSDFDAAIERDSESAEFYEARGLARLCVGNWDGAGEDLARAVVLAALGLKRHFENGRRACTSGILEHSPLISRNKRSRSL